MKLTEKQVRELAPRVKDLKSFTDSLNIVIDKYEINTPLRLAAFLSRAGHESWDFQKLKEVWTNTSQQQKYDPTSDSRVSKILGNTQRGDGIKFLGRGFLGITGRDNYAKYSKFAGYDFVTNPEKLEEYPWNLDSASWFWSTRKLNTLADKGDIVKIVKIINGGTNGLEDTCRRYANYLIWFKKNFG